jgi:hypothetical protein
MSAAELGHKPQGDIMNRIVVTTLLLCLSACGGGGGGSTPIAPVTSYDFIAALAKRTNMGFLSNVTVSGTINNQPIGGTGTLNFAAAVNGNFNGAVALVQTVTANVTITIPGQPDIPVSSMVADYYAPGTYNFLLEISGSGYDQPTAPLMYPATVMVGSSGTLGTIYGYSSGGVPDNTHSDLSYVVKANPANANTVIYEAVQKFYDAANTLTETDRTDYSVGNAGAIVFISATSVSGANTITFTAT